MRSLRRRPIIEDHHAFRIAIGRRVEVSGRISGSGRNGRASHLLAPNRWHRVLLDRRLNHAGRDSSVGRDLSVGHFALSLLVEDFLKDFLEEYVDEYYFCLKTWWDCYVMCREMLNSDGFFSG